ncbi:MAG: RecQ family ATP-dependent DNA helicase, partial [Armatimonadota bacterium]
MLRDPQQVLQDVYGFDSFIGPQRQIIDRIMSGQDALVIMPTGGGKSLCYQVPSVCMEGLGVIVSPLIALMEDQVQALKQNGVRAAYLNSTVAPEQSRQIHHQLFNGGLDLLYVAPERLLMDHFLGMLGRLDIALFAIDEAHCVSEWGPNFRPDYHRLKVLHERFPQVPRIALTATADPHTRRDMLHQLRMQDADVTITTFDRPNIHFRVEPKSRAKEKLVEFITSEHDGQAGIVYCMTRKSTEHTAEYLSRRGINALPY